MVELNLATTDLTDQWLEMGATSFQADGGQRIMVAARLVEERGRNRIAPRVRPWQRASKLDSTGPDSDSWTLEILFHNDVTEPDLGELPRMYPDRLDALIEAFKTGETLTLHLPWKRNLRVKAVDWTRRATAEEFRGGEILTVSILEDNEDNLDREAFERVSGKAQALNLADGLALDLESMGAWTGSLEDVTVFASELQGLLNAPGDYLDDLASAAKRLRNAVKDTLNALLEATPGAGGGLDAAAGASAKLKALELLELAAGAEAEATASLPKTRTVTFNRDRDIYSIAAEFRQSPRDLIRVNTNLEDPAFIEAGTPVLVLV